MSYFYSAQICLNGHVRSQYSEDYISSLEKFCTICGATTLLKCPKCDSQIRGRSRGEFNYMGSYKLPSYCYNCGNAYPWTSSAIDSAKELLMLSNKLSHTDVDSMDESFKDLIIKTPKTQVSAMKLKILLQKTGKATSDAVYSLFVDIMSEAVKKIIWPDS